MTLHQIIERELPLLKAITDQKAREARPDSSSWTRKQELGHLIDSATNNHVRFVLAALDGRFDGPRYAQDSWVGLHAYQDMPWEQIVDLWYHYNQLLAHLWKQIPEARHQAPCSVGGQAEVSLKYLYDDYILHMRHHVDHVLDRDPITPYPQL